MKKLFGVMKNWIAKMPVHFPQMRCYPAHDMAENEQTDTEAIGA